MLSRVRHILAKVLPSKKRSTDSASATTENGKNPSPPPAKRTKSTTSISNENTKAGAVDSQAPAAVEATGKKLPTEMKALTMASTKGPAEVQTHPLPSLRDEYMLVRVKAVAVNPTDWKSAAGYWPTDMNGCRLGCDYSGVVEAVGSKVTKKFVPGDRVAGMAHGCNNVQKEDGAFAEYVMVKGDLQWSIPDTMTVEEAATLGLGIITVGQGLYQAIGLPLPSATATVSSVQAKTPLLISGGSTATGVLGIQYARLSGCRVVATSSPHNFDYVKSLGAEAVFDHSDAECATKIRDHFAATGEKLKLAWDCIGNPDTAKICVSAIDVDGGHYRSLIRIDDEVVHKVNPKVDNGLTFAYTVFGETFNKIRLHEANEKDYEFGKQFVNLSQQLLGAGQIKPIKFEVNRGGSGLEGVLTGFQELKDNKVSGLKLVYTL